MSADEDLSCRCGGLERHDVRRPGATDHEFAVRPSDDEHRVFAAVDSDRHAQDDVALSGTDPADFTEPPPHRRRGGACPQRVLLIALLVVEQQHHRIATELHE